MEPYTEHKQDDADFGVVRGRGCVGHKPRKMGTHAHTRHQIAHQRRQAHFLGDEARNQGGGQTAGEGQDKMQIVRHGRSS